MRSLWKKVAFALFMGLAIIHTMSLSNLMRKSRSSANALPAVGTPAPSDVPEKFVVLQKLPLSDTHETKAPVQSRVLYPSAPPTASPTRGLPRIFVSIAAYRDVECPVTVMSALSNASHPERIVFGIVEQILPQDPKCVEAYCKMLNDKGLRGELCNREQFRVSEVNASEAKGVTVARSMGELLVRDEEFFIQTDSHVKFANKWDDRLIDEWKSLQNEYGILTVYTMPYESIDQRNSIPHICKAWFQVSSPADVESMPHYQSFIYPTPPKPRLQHAWAAGFAFSKTHAIKAAPYDPYTLYLFHGEEYSKAARLWTHGYDFYSTTANYVVHNYKRHKAPRIFDGDFWTTKLPISKRSSRRVKYMLGIPNNTDCDKTDLEKYSLGKKRTLEQYIKFSGIDPFQKKIDGRCDPHDYWTTTVPVVAGVD